MGGPVEDMWRRKIGPVVTNQIIYIVSTADHAGVYRGHWVVLLHLEFSICRRVEMWILCSHLWLMSRVFSILVWRKIGRWLLFSWVPIQIWLLWLGPSANVSIWGETARVSWVRWVSSRRLAGGRFGVVLSRERGSSFMCGVVCAWEQHEGLWGVMCIWGVSCFAHTVWH